PGSHVTATVTLTPASRMEQNNYIITALPNGTTDNARRQVPARVLNTTSAPQTATGNATGSINATTAKGPLKFLNGNGHDVTISTTVLHGASGVAITFNGPIIIPAAGVIIVTGYAVSAGSGGNIPAFDISGSCCTPGVSANNISSFSGGQDAITNSVIQQSDIDGAANPLVATLAQSTQVSLQKQVKATEKMVDGSFACTPTTTADQKAGDIAKQVHVSVTVACHEEVYDALAAHQMAISLLLGQAQNDPALNAQYALVGQITPRVLSDSMVSADGKVNLEMQVQGLWVYQFTPQMQQNIKGKIIKITQKSAMDVLLHQSGVAAAKIELSSGTTMPATVNDITLTVLTLPAAQTTPTTGPGTPTIGPNSTPGGSNNGTPGGSNNGTPGGPSTNPTPTAVNGLGGS
ncbi:MAG: hypothetical protein ABI234_09585, partial [Ktedonobacteraceae bacterium]